MRVDIPAKRRAKILDYLRATGAASIHELTVAVRGSQSTIRRDLDYLIEAGYLERTHGGVLLPPLSATFERETSLKAHLQGPRKRAIGAAAALRLGARQSVIFDGSSTVKEAMLAAAARGLVLTAVTNCLEIAQACAAAPNWRVILPGGIVRAGTDLLTGDATVGFFHDLHVDVCLIGTHAITGSLLTESTLEIAGVKRAMIRSARRSILLADSSKFAEPALGTFAELGELAEVVTDDGISPEHLESLHRHCARVTVVPVPAGV